MVLVWGAFFKLLLGTQESSCWYFVTLLRPTCARRPQPSSQRLSNNRPAIRLSSWPHWKSGAFALRIRHSIQSKCAKSYTYSYYHNKKKMGGEARPPWPQRVAVGFALFLRLPTQPLEDPRPEHVHQVRAVRLSKRTSEDGDWLEIPSDILCEVTLELILDAIQNKNLKNNYGIVINKVTKDAGQEKAEKVGESPKNFRRQFMCLESSFSCLRVCLETGNGRVV